MRPLVLIFLTLLPLTGWAESISTTRERALKAWREPAPVQTPRGLAPTSKEARTYVYWTSVADLLDSMYAIPLDDAGRKPRGFWEMGGGVCKLVADKINALSTRGVDEDAVKGGQELYSLLLTEGDYWTDWGGIMDYLKNNPAPIDPIKNITSGISGGLNARARIQDTQKDLARDRALLESRYEHSRFRMLHELQ